MDFNIKFENCSQDHYDSSKVFCWEITTLEGEFIYSGYSDSEKGALDDAFSYVKEYLI